MHMFWLWIPATTIFMSSIKVKKTRAVMDGPAPRRPSLDWTQIIIVLIAGHRVMQRDFRSGRDSYASMNVTQERSNTRFDSRYKRHRKDGYSPRAITRV